MSQEISVGQRFGRLVIVGQSAPSTFLVRCDCGRRKKVRRDHLKHIQSCGCYRDEIREKHGMHQSLEYSTWEHVVQRCTNPNDSNYKNYGGRGIRLCQSWRESFIAFYEDLGPRLSKSYTIERLNNDGHYSCGKCEECIENNWPFNCKWILKGEQSKNTRAVHFLTFQGKTQPTFTWAVELGIPENTIRTRIHRGWTDEQVLSLPPQKGKKPK